MIHAPMFDAEEDTSLLVSPSENSGANFVMRQDPAAFDVGETIRVYLCW